MINANFFVISLLGSANNTSHHDVMTWGPYMYYWPFVRWIRLLSVFFLILLLKLSPPSFTCWRQLKHCHLFSLICIDALICFPFTKNQWRGTLMFICCQLQKAFEQTVVLPIVCDVMMLTLSAILNLLTIKALPSFLSYLRWCFNMISSHKEPVTRNVDIYLLSASKSCWTNSYFAGCLWRHDVDVTPRWWIMSPRGRQASHLSWWER